MQASLDCKRRPHRGHLHRLLFDDAAPEGLAVGVGSLSMGEEFTESDILWGGSASSLPDLAPNPSPARSGSSSILKPKKRSPATTRSSAAVPASLPVQIPDWSKILGADAPQAGRQKRRDADDGSWGSVGGGGGYCYGEGDEDDDDDEDDAGNNNGGVIPPHEYLWRRRRGASVASAGGAAFSLCEGLGRTLKGRDLSRVRNAVWEKIGFQD